jgi:hypothetical protein
MSARVTWSGGGEATLVSIAADGIVLESTVPWPPGSRVEGTVRANDGELSGPEPAQPVALRVKVHSSKRQAGGEFLVQGRPIDLTRAARERLVALLRAGNDQSRG